LPQKKGFVEVVKVLLADPTVNPAADDNYAIRWASSNGYLDVVKILLNDPRVDPSACNNFALRMASSNGYLDVVKILLADPRVDPSACDSSAIRLASANGLALRGELGSGEHTKVVELLKAHQQSKQEQTKSKTKTIEINLESVKNITYKTKEKKQMMFITYK